MQLRGLYIVVLVLGLCFMPLETVAAVFIIDTVSWCIAPSENHQVRQPPVFKLPIRQRALQDEW